MTTSPRDPRYDILFEQVKIGPVTAKNRFYQTPQCAGMGDTLINGQAKHREMKAEGGWAVVNTEVNQSHFSSSLSYPCMHLWDDSDIPMMAKVVDSIHKHGALAGTEIGHMGSATANLLSREPPIAPSSVPVSQLYPVQARTMDKSDILDLLRWQTKAARRAQQAGVDIIYADASGIDGPPLSFVSRRLNHRTDEYGGSVENRIRLLRQYIEATREGAGPNCAVAMRLCIDELMGADGITVEEEGLAIIESMGELVDLWDINVSDWENDSIVSRFGKEGSQERFAAFVKERTSKPVVGVGRYTSPDTMASVIRRGVQDFIGAARPSIADPFLPKKIEEGRLEDIRECIGCNICATGFVLNAPSRCTQNPTVGDEWRRGWHPEKIPRKTSEDRVLIVGAGPAGLECAHALARRGYAITLTEAGTELGGRVRLEAGLPGLAEWIRVRDYREYHLRRMINVDIYPDNTMLAEHILEFGNEQVVIATGASWRKDGFGRAHHEPVPGSELPHVITPDQIMAGQEIADGPVVVFDDDHYYMGNIIAEKLRNDGHEVTIATPSSELSYFTYITQEHRNTIKRIYELGITVLTHHAIAQITADAISLAHIYSEQLQTINCNTVVMVTHRDPNDSLYHELMVDQGRLQDAGIAVVKRIGDCLSPSTIAAAVWDGHRFARECNEDVDRDVPNFRREQVQPEILS